MTDTMFVAPGDNVDDIAAQLADTDKWKENDPSVKTVDELPEHLTDDEEEGPVPSGNEPFYAELDPFVHNPGNMPNPDGFSKF